MKEGGDNEKTGTSFGNKLADDVKVDEYGLPIEKTGNAEDDEEIEFIRKIVKQENGHG